MNLSPVKQADLDKHKGNPEAHALILAAVVTQPDGTLAIDLDHASWLAWVKKYARQATPKEAAQTRRWKTVERSWNAAQEVQQVWESVQEKNLLQRMVAFGKALLSRGLTNKEAEPRIVALRQLSCFGDTTRGVPACVGLGFDESQQFHFCNDCGCGAREVARLSSPGSEKAKPVFLEDDYIKLKYPALECPRRRPGFSNAQ